MSNNLSRRGSYLFAVLIATSIIFVIVAVVAFIAVRSSLSAADEYPVYSYGGYIDRTESQLFTQNGGAQLYEAESGEATDCTLSARLRASGGACVEMDEGAVLKFTITSVADCTARLYVSLSYSSETASDAPVADIFAIDVNGTAVDVGGTAANCYNEMQYKESLLGEISLTEGKNSIEFRCIGSDCDIDYIMLNPPLARTGGESTIGTPEQNFESDGNAQIFEAESFFYGGQTVTEYDTAASGYYYTRTERGGSVWLYVQSDSACTAGIALQVRGDGDVQSASVRVNDGKELYFSSLTSSGNYPRYFLGEVALEEGVNSIEITATERALGLDSVILNADVNYSPSASTQIYEAESAELSGGNLVQNGDIFSGGGTVAYNVAGSSIAFSIISRGEGASEEMLSLRMSYFGSMSNLSQTLEISFNGEKLPLEGISLIRSSDYDDYYDLVAGVVNVMPGKNSLVITSTNGVNGDYNLDHITLSKWVYESGGIYEAEYAALSGNNRAVIAPSASGGGCVGYNSPGSTVTFCIYSPAERTVSMYLRASCLSSEDVYMSRCLSVSVGGENINIYGMYMSGTGSLAQFSGNYVGNITLRAGLNVIKITSASTIYNLDCIALT